MREDLFDENGVFFCRIPFPNEGESGGAESGEEGIRPFSSSGEEPVPHPGEASEVPLCQQLDPAGQRLDPAGQRLDLTGQRLDSFLAAETGLSRARIQRLAEDGFLLVNGKPGKKNARIAAGDEIELTLPETEEAEARPEDIPLDVVYEDGDIIVVNKPVGMVVHPAPGHDSGTLVNALLFRCGDSLSGIGGVLRPGIVHRIDRDTSGLISAAKNDAAHAGLSLQLKDHTMRREYRMIVTGGLRDESGTVDAPIGRHPADRKKMAVIRAPGAHARDAVTHWRVLERYPSSGFTYAAAELETGRTHQIRVHMAHIGHPLMGDTVYGGGRTPFERKHPSLLTGQMLHAAALTLIHPRTGERMRWEAPLPPNFERMLEILRAGE